MTKRGFYAKLAAQSMRKNAKFYLPYLISCMGAAAMFYITLYLNGNKGIVELRGSSYVKVLLGLGAVVIAIFSAIVLFYTNSFLMKRRKTELGLYNILGMEKRHIGCIMLWETIYTSLIGIIGGLAVGMLLSKLLLLLMCAIMRFDIPFGFEISKTGIIATVLVYGAIFFLNLLVNLLKIGKSKPIELLHSGNEGEREPKTKWILTLFGFLTLGGGYAIAITVESPLSALALFFIAVIMVIIGTYCLFTTGSITVLKLLRKNKTYYYKAKHFTSISGMIHRMKRNAAGLASICILSTMVLVMISTTLCLYTGADESLRTRYPHDFAISYRSPSKGTIDAAIETVKKQADEEGYEITDVVMEKSLEIRSEKVGNKFLKLSGQTDSAKVHILTDAVYAEHMGLSDFSLKSGEAYGHIYQAGAVIPKTISIYGREFNVIKDVGDYKMTGRMSGYLDCVYMFIVCEEDMYAIDSELENSGIENTVYFDMTGTDEEKERFFENVYDMLTSSETQSETGEITSTKYERLYGECRAANTYDFYDMYGGFFFLGIFLGTLFMMATVLIIYYKQISEGYEDAGRFKIMQQVGMSAKEVKSSIRSQVLTVFFLPIIMAGIHVLAAFPMISKLLALFNMYNIMMFALSCVSTFLVFAVVYAIIYMATARAYYKIVKQ